MSSRVPSWSCSIQRHRRAAGDPLGGGGAIAGPSSRWQRRGWAGCPTAGRRRVRAAGRRASPRRRRRRPGVCRGRPAGAVWRGAWPGSAETPGLPVAGRCRLAGVGEGFGADVDDHLVEVRVAGGGDLPGQVATGHLHQRIGQARPCGCPPPGPGSRPARRRPRPAPVPGGRRPGGGRRRWPAAARGVLGGVAVRAVRVLTIPGGRAQRLHHHRPLSRRQPDRHRHRPVLAIDAHPPRRPGRHSAASDTGGARARTAPLRRGHRPGDLRQARLGFRGGDPGQRPHLRIRHPPRRELGADHRQVPPAPGPPGPAPGRCPGRPGTSTPATPHTTADPSTPSPAARRTRHQQQEPARPRGQVPGQLTDPLLQPLQRHHGPRRGLAGRQRLNRLLRIFFRSCIRAYDQGLTVTGRPKRPTG